jgi:hypothetical protein
LLPANVGFSIGHPGDAVQHLVLQVEKVPHPSPFGVTVLFEQFRFTMISSFLSTQSLPDPIAYPI